MSYLIVGFLKTDPKARYQGYMFYFKEGFCWSDIVSDTKIKCRLKSKGVHDVTSMSLFSSYFLTPDYYLICTLISEFMGKYLKSFVNNTNVFQINDARKLPIIIPNEEQLKFCNQIFQNIIELKKKLLTETKHQIALENELSILEKQMNDFICNLYSTI